MEKVLCHIHGSLCLLKTGTKDGPNKGKSFYICGARQENACDFQQVADVPASHCLLHEDSLVELQALVRHEAKTCYKLFFRCVQGKAEGRRWCGHVPHQIKETKCSTAKNEFQDKCPHERNPFKAQNRNGNEQLSKWKILNGAEKENENAEEKCDVKSNTEISTQVTNVSSESWRSTELPKGMKLKKKTFSEGCKSTVNESDGKKEIIESEDVEKSHSKPLQDDVSCKEKLNKGQKSLGTKVYLKTENEEEEAKKHLHSTKISSVCSVNSLTNQKKSQLKSVPSIKEPESRQVNDKNDISKPGCTKNISKCLKETEDHPHVNESLTHEVLSSRKESPVTSSSKADPKLSNCEKQRDMDKNKEIGKVQNVGEDQVILESSQSKLKTLLPAASQQASTGSVQKTITSFPGFIPVTNVHRFQDSKSLYNNLSLQLKQKKATVSSVNLSALPDKGERLLNQVMDLEKALGALKVSVPESNGDEKDADSRAENCIASSSDQVKPSNKTVSSHRHTILLPEPMPQSEPLKQPFCSGSSYSMTLGGIQGVNTQQSAFYGGRMTEDRLLTVRNMTVDAIDKLHKSLESCPAAETQAEDPKGLKVPLLPHQKHALAWLLWRETQMPCGGILADDMGLGKTLTMIALIMCKKKKEKEESQESKQKLWISKKDQPGSSPVNSQGSLIICPASLVHHWKKEIERHVKGSRLSVYLYHGQNREKNARILSEYDVVVTTYSLVSKEIPVKKEEDSPIAEEVKQDSKAMSHSPLMQVIWSRIILDEAHNIKNPRVQTSIAVCKLRAEGRWAVTGTPIHNNLLDMYSLLKFLRCSPFDEYKLWKAQVDNGSKRGGERLNILTQSLLLRRTKDQLDSVGKPLVSLPERNLRIHSLKLSNDEQSVYDVLLAQSRSTLQSYLKRHEKKDESCNDCTINPFEKVAQEFGVTQSPAICSSQGNPQLQATSTIHILSLLLRLRQCCCHLSLLKKALDHTDLQTEGISLTLEEQLNALTLSEVSTLESESTVTLNGSKFNSELFNDTKESTKIAALLAKLKNIAASPDLQKSVIVSQWTSMLRIVAVHLDQMGLSYTTIDGSVNPKKRIDLVEDFNTNRKGKQVMLLSLCAGGVGLNLVGGNHLFLLDLHWNPALEDQACDRVYRVGQLRDVTIHRFVCEGTVEEKISQLQGKKKELAKSVLSGMGSSFNKLTLADLKIIFDI
ncbi:transcription termination factor 2 [Erpetoichthys calabaricus]|uniref:Transcription termination factor 2 n=1 Tax=Erpetoichthys calabaricus TaxID=27687 RepID=A0A8C4RV95_ERPCA|nr:transcription termination factor 2 [Erpetoichthys calabaricus]